MLTKLVLTAALTILDTSRLASFSARFERFVTAEGATAVSDALSAVCEALTSLVASLVAVSLTVWLVVEVSLAFSLDATPLVATPLKISAAVKASLSEVAFKVASEVVATSWCSSAKA